MRATQEKSLRPFFVACKSNENVVGNFKNLFHLLPEAIPVAALHYRKNDL